MLLPSTGETRGNAAAVLVGNLPVHTFDFGNGHDPKVLLKIENTPLFIDYFKQRFSCAAF